MDPDKKDPYAFFRQVRQYFGEDDIERFWNRVLFFNFLPNCVGSDDERYAFGTAEQRRRGKQRVLDIFGTHRPHKALVFTRKGWEQFPPTREEAEGSECKKLGASFGDFTWGTYPVRGFTVTAFGLRHPQYAPFEHMHDAVQHILSL
ncbi:MAG TPA: hypothetical protein VFA95_11540 [Gammaproteobacteria bacterium]|nr:hypothetical protein [Gammaproteobacteria bacterium]